MNQKRIVIAQRGWVFIGNVSEDGDNVIIEKAKNIRKWGTSKGLGELAMLGPTPKTILDEYGTVIIHKLAIIGQVNVTSERW